MTTADLLLFLGLVVPLSLSPGPVNITLAGLGVSSGIVRGLPFYIGLNISAFAIAVVAGLGLSEAFLANPTLYQVLRYAGIAYIAYLAVKFLVAVPSLSSDSGSTHGLLDGLLLTSLNPKFYVMVTVLFSQFLAPGSGRLLLLVALFIVVLALSQFVWLAAGASVRPLLRSATAMRIQSVVFGVLLLSVAGYMAVSP